MGSAPSKHKGRHHHHHRNRGMQIPPPGFEPRRRYQRRGLGQMPFGQTQPGQMQSQETEDAEDKEGEKEKEEAEHVSPMSGPGLGVEYGRKAARRNYNDLRLLGGYGGAGLGPSSGGDLDMGMNPDMLQRAQRGGARRDYKDSRPPPLQDIYGRRHRKKKTGRHGRERGSMGIGMDPNIQEMKQARAMGYRGEMDPNALAITRTRAMEGDGGLEQGGNRQVGSPGVPNAGLPDPK